MKRLVILCACRHAQPGGVPPQTMRRGYNSGRNFFSFSASIIIAFEWWKDFRRAHHRPLAISNHTRLSMPAHESLPTWNAIRNSNLQINRWKWKEIGRKKNRQKKTICIALSILHSCGCVQLGAAAAYLYRLAQFNDRNRKDLFKSFTF